MPKIEQAGTDLTQAIMHVIVEKNPQDIRELINLVEDKTSYDEREILECIIQLQDHGKVLLEGPISPEARKLNVYVKTSAASWYWAVVVLATTTAIFVFAVPENMYPIVYVRNVLGMLFVGWLPGYSLVRLLFLSGLPLKTSKSFGSIEIVALSIGLSFALVPIIGLFLNFTIWRISQVPMVISLLALTLIFATTALLIEHKHRYAKNTEADSS